MNKMTKLSFLSFSCEDKSHKKGFIMFVKIRVLEFVYYCVVDVLTFRFIPWICGAKIRSVKTV